MADVVHTHRLTGPYSRMVQDAESKAWSLVHYGVGDAITPTKDEQDAHPDRFEEWPPSGTVLEPPPAPEEPPADEPTRARSHR